MARGQLLPMPPPRRGGMAAIDGNSEIETLPTGTVPLSEPTSRVSAGARKPDFLPTPECWHRSDQNGHRRHRRPDHDDDWEDRARPNREQDPGHPYDKAKPQCGLASSCTLGVANETDDERGDRQDDEHIAHARAIIKPPSSHVHYDRDEHADCCRYQVRRFHWLDPSPLKVATVESRTEDFRLLGIHPGTVRSSLSQNTREPEHYIADNT